MEIIEVACANCGAPMKYTPGSKHLKCDFCESEYVMQDESSNPIETLTPVFYGGGVLYNAYIPYGFSCNVFEDMDGVSMDSPKSLPLHVFSNDTNIYFFPYAFYKDGGSGRHRIEPMTITNYYKYVPVDRYAFRRIPEVFKGAQNVQLLSRMDDEILAKMAEGYMFMASNVIRDVMCESGKFRFSFMFNGMQLQGYIATILCKKQGMGEQTQAQQDTGVMGIFKNAGKNLMGGNKWGRAFDVVLATTSTDMASAEELFNKFLYNIRYGPVYDMLVQQERAAVQNIRIQGAMENQQRQFAAQNRLSQSIQQRNDIIMSGWENRRATQNRMMDKVSEGIRGVNSYTNMYGQKVEASVRYDHVYQDGTTYIASDGNLNFGKIPGNWTELKRNY